MTKVGLNPATSTASSRRRTLLPRNPTPWSSPGIPALPPQVQRLLQQIGGSSYQTYQPFQVVQPLITPQPTVSFRDCPTPTEKSSSSTSQNGGDIHNSHPGLSQVDLTFSTHALERSPANETWVDSNSTQGVRFSPLPLTHQCRKRLVSYFGLRKLRRILLSMQAPKCVAKFLSTVSAKECVVRSSAPLLDVFEEPFFHRAVTWRVQCCLDGQPYLATYAHTDTSALVECEWMTSGEADDELDATSSAWLHCDHPHIMRVWGVVVDPPTGNNFYLLDTPIATLDQILARLHQHNTRLPERLVWRVLGGVASALLHARRRRLPYAPLHLSNVFLLPAAVAIENALTRKKQLVECSCSSSAGCCAESCFVQNVGRIIHALCTCGTRSLKDARAHHVEVVMHDLRRQYSDTLLTLLVRTLSGGPRVASPRWVGTHNGRRAFAAVNQPMFLSRGRKADENFEVLESFGRKPLNVNSLTTENDFGNSTDYVASRSSCSFSSNMHATSSDSSLLSPNPFHSSTFNASGYPCPGTEASLSLTSDLGNEICEKNPEEGQVKLEKSSSSELLDSTGLTSHSKLTVPHATESLKTQYLRQPHFTTVNSAHNVGSKDILSDTPGKLECRSSHHDISTPPKDNALDRKVHHEKRRKRTHHRKRHPEPCHLSKENISPANPETHPHVDINLLPREGHFTSSHDIRISATGQEKTYPSSPDVQTFVNTRERIHQDDRNLYVSPISTSASSTLKIKTHSSHSNVTSTNLPFSQTEFSLITLEEIVALAEAEVKKTCCGGESTLEEALRRSPRELVELATSRAS